MNKLIKRITALEKGSTNKSAKTLADFYEKLNRNNEPDHFYTVAIATPNNLNK